MKQLRYLPEHDGCRIERGDDGLFRIVGATLSELRGWIPA